MKFMKRDKTAEQIQHHEIDKALEDHEKRLEQMARRLRRLEIEAGIYKPPLRRTN